MQVYLIIDTFDDNSLREGGEVGLVWWGRQGATHQVEPRAASREGIVLQGGGSKVGVHHMARLLVQVANPASKLAGIGQRG